MKKEYKQLDVQIRALEDDILSVQNASFELDEDESGMVTPPWFFN